MTIFSQKLTYLYLVGVLYKERWAQQMSIQHTFMCLHVAYILHVTQNESTWGAWVAQSVEHLPSAQVVIPGSWDQVPHWVPCGGASAYVSFPSSYVSASLSLSVSLMNT